MYKKLNDSDDNVLRSLSLLIEFSYDILYNQHKRNYIINGGNNKMSKYFGTDGIRGKAEIFDAIF